jgi:hypothetical protein
MNGYIQGYAKCSKYGYAACMKNHAEGSPVRITVDLAPDLHSAMKAWAEERGPRLTLAKVYRALSKELLSDPVLADSVLARIRR